MHAHRSDLSDNSTVVVDPSLGSLDEFDAETAPRALDLTPAGIPSTRPSKSLSSRVRDLESDGVVLASLLSIVAITYGSFLTAAWRHPVDLQAVSAPTAIVDVVQSAPAAVSEPGAAGAEGVSARTLTALWQQRDTRSLDQAFADLRRQTLAFHRCGMRKTANDRAVANCEGAGSSWTIDFRRSAGRWQIANVATR